MAASAAETKTEEEAIVVVPCRFSRSSPPLTLNGGDDRLSVSVGDDDDDPVLSASRLLRDDPESLQEKVRRRRLALLCPTLLPNLTSTASGPHSRLPLRLIAGIT